MTYRVIYPRGLPDAEDWRVPCRSLVRYCGGTGRTFVALHGENPARVTERIRQFLSQDGEPPLVVLIASDPFAILLSMRKELELAVPKLLGARWLVFVGMELSPRLIAEAGELGMVEGSGVDGPLWLTRAGSFLLLGADLRTPGSLALRVEALDATGALSRRRPAIGTSYSERPPPRLESIAMMEPLRREGCASAPSNSRPLQLAQQAVGAVRDPYAVVLGPAPGYTEDDRIPESAVVRTTPHPGTPKPGDPMLREAESNPESTRLVASAEPMGHKLGSMRLATRPWRPGTPGKRQG